MINHA